MYLQTLFYCLFRPFCYCRSRKLQNVLLYVSPLRSCIVPPYNGLPCAPIYPEALPEIPDLHTCASAPVPGVRRIPPDSSEATVHADRYLLSFYKRFPHNRSVLYFHVRRLPCPEEGMYRYQFVRHDFQILQLPP